MENGFILVKKETLQELVDNFYEVCDLCNELDVHEHEGLNEKMEQMSSWVTKKFGCEINKEHYD